VRSDLAGRGGLGLTLAALLSLFNLACDAMDMGKWHESNLRWDAAIDSYRKAAIEGDPEAQFRLARLLETKTEASREVIPWLRRSAEAGHPSALCLLARFYRSGHEAGGEVVPQSNTEAVRWYRRAAASGLWRPAGILGQRYRDGDGVRQDCRMAYLWHSLQARAPSGQGRDEQGAREFARKAAADVASLMSPSELSEATSVLVGLDDASDLLDWPLPQDEVELIRRRASEGDARAQLDYARILDVGDGVPEDRIEARRWYESASELGLAEAIHELGVSFLPGTASSPDLARAKDLLATAADLGYSEAAYTLALVLYNGMGAEIARGEAAQWLSRAAAEGHAWAQQKLGDMYAAGDGVALDGVEAYRWYTAAISNDLRYRTGERARLAASLTQDDLERAERLAVETTGPSALHSIGALYAWGAYSTRGPVVERDHEKAIRFLREGALSCDRRSMSSLAELHSQRGEETEACAWYLAAIDLGAPVYNRESELRYPCMSRDFDSARAFLETFPLDDCFSPGTSSHP
jgi:TPR repeat protein